MKAFKASVAILLTLSLYDCRSMDTNQPRKVDTKLESVNNILSSEFPQIPIENGPTTLFSDQSVLDMEIISDFPYRTIRNIPEPGRYPSTLKYRRGSKSIEMPIELEARGFGRLSHCDFAPFKIHFKKTQNGTLFEGLHDSLKVVPHCDEGSLSSAKFPAEDTIMIEMLLYRMVEAFGVHAFKTRPVKIFYKARDGKPITHKLAFVIENKRDLVKRYRNLKSFTPDDYADRLLKETQSRGLNQSQTMEFLESQLEITNFITTFFSQLMLLNSDWSGTITGGNMETFLTDRDKVIRTHYDLDLSVLTMKFPRGEKLTYDQETVYQLPSSVNSDIRFITNLCTSPAFPFKQSLKTSACKELLPKITQRQEAVTNVVRDFSLIRDDQKKHIFERIDVFFQAIQQAHSKL